MKTLIRILFLGSFILMALIMWQFAIIYRDYSSDPHKMISVLKEKCESVGIPFPKSLSDYPGTTIQNVDAITNISGTEGNSNAFANPHYQNENAKKELERKKARANSIRGEMYKIDQSGNKITLDKGEVIGSDSPIITQEDSSSKKN